jgi:hypothetical protein
MNVDLGSQRIINLQNPVENQDAATKIYVDNAVDSDNNLLEGNIWVGDNTNNQAMVDASESGFMLVGDGTTVNSVDIHGDIEVDATGLTTIQPDAVTTLEIVDETILATDIAEGAVTTSEIFNETILAEDIATGAVTTSEILNETILAEDIAVGAVTSEEILDETILAVDIATGAVTTAEILDETILAVDIATGAVTSEEILDQTIADADLDKLNIPLSGFGAAVTNVDLGSQRIINLQNPVENQDAATKTYVDNAVDSDNNLLEGNIWVGDNTNNQAMVDASESGFMLVGDGTTVNSVDIHGDVEVDATGLTTIQPNAVTTLEIVDETILATDIAEGAVTTSEIFNETILAEDIATGAVTTSEILNETILAEDIAVGAVTSEEILDETILAVDIATGAVTTAEILDETILAVDIATGAVTSEEILDQTIADADLDKLNIPLSGFGAAVTNVDLGSQRIINLQNPVDNQDAATKIYIDAAIDNAVDTGNNLAEGNIWVGDNSNNQAMVNASQSGFMLVGDGTTVNSVDITGDVEVDAAGLTTIQADAVTSMEIQNETILNEDIADGTINLREKVTSILPIENGGTNSGTPLVGGRVMVSRDGRIVEAGVMNPGQVVVGTASDPAVVTITGDISIDQSGATVIGNEAVNSAKISDGSVMNSDIAPTAAIDATKIAAGTVDNDELGYLDGVSSGIQGQFTGVLTGIADEMNRAMAAETTLANDITAEEARAIAAETGLANDITAEETRAMAAEAILATDITTEETRAIAAETALASDIAAEETRAIAAETTLTTNLETEVTRATAAEAALATDITTEETRAIAAETALSNDITAEEARAIASETALASDIAAEETRAIAAETALSNDITAEEARAIASETALASDIAAEETRAIAAETTLTANLETEVTRATAAEAALATDITAEETRAIAAETALSNDITAEEARAIASETALASDIAAEETRAIAAETTLTANLETEVTRATAAEAALATDITAEETRAIAAETALSSDITAEEARAIASETALASDITAEETRAIAAETALVKCDITAEEARAIAAETTLTSNLATEASRAINAEAVLTAGLTSEANRAITAEAALASDITAERNRAITAETNPLHQPFQPKQQTVLLPMMLKVDANAAITDGTNTKISFDSKGLVTGGSQAILASADFNNQGAANTVLHGNASGAPTWGRVTNEDLSGEIDATRLVDGSIDNNEFLRLDGVSANIQTQINSIMTFGTTLISGLNPNAPVRTDASENLVSGAINLASADVTAILPVARGGTGTSSGTLGGIPYFNTGSTMASSGLLVQNGIMIGGGAGAAPSTIATANNGVVVTGPTGVPSVQPRIQQSNLPAGLVLLIYSDEDDMAEAVGYPNAKSTTIQGNEYSRIIIESEVSLGVGSNSVDADWNFNLIVNGITVETIRLGLTSIGAVGGSLKTSVTTLASGGTITISVTPLNLGGTWTVKSLRIYGVI